MERLRLEARVHTTLCPCVSVVLVSVEDHDLLSLKHAQPIQHHAPSHELYDLTGICVAEAASKLNGFPDTEILLQKLSSEAMAQS